MKKPKKDKIHWTPDEIIGAIGLIILLIIVLHSCSNFSDKLPKKQYHSVKEWEESTHEQIVPADYYEYQNRKYERRREER